MFGPNGSWMFQMKCKVKIAWNYPKLGMVGPNLSNFFFIFFYLYNLVKTDPIIDTIFSVILLNQCWLETFGWRPYPWQIEQMNSFFRQQKIMVVRDFYVSFLIVLDLIDRQFFLTFLKVLFYLLIFLLDFWILT